MQDYLVKLQDEYEQVAGNQISRFEPDMSPELFKNACEEVVTNLENLRYSIVKLLSENLFPKLENIESISAQDESELYELAQKLSSFETRLDPGIALKIYQALLEVAHANKDDAKIIKYSYWCGITQFFFYGKRDKAILEHFEKGASYAGKYDNFEDPEIRQYIHRCLGNTSMILYSSENPQDAINQEESNFNFWNKLIFAGKDPDFPWLNYFLNGYNHRRSFLTRDVHKDPDSVSKEKINEILDISIIMNKLYHKNREYHNVFGGTRYDYNLWEAQFLSGLISFDNLIENIKKKQSEVAPDDYSQDAMYIKIHLNSHLIFYSSKMSKLQDRKDEITEMALKETINYFSSIPKTVNTESVTMNLSMLIKDLSEIFSPSEQLDFILKMTTYRHIPTYAHSVKVGKIAKILTKSLVKENPACFIGCLDTETEDDVKAKADELYEFAEISGICHDIGKISCIDNPYMHIRLLTEEEFETIKSHPDEGVSMMSREDGNTQNAGYIDVIAGHHKYYDNSKGYPESFDIRESKNRMMIDIISVANSIVSATDSLSRTHAKTKKFETVVGEIKEGAGTRYSPAVAKALDDKTVYSSIDRYLEEESMNAYYNAYLHVWGGEKQA